MSLDKTISELESVKEGIYKSYQYKVTIYKNHYNGYINVGGEGIDRTINIHGGKTYKLDKNGWIGFDCNHAGDVCVSNNGKPLKSSYRNQTSFTDETLWFPGDVVNECKSIIDQIGRNGNNIQFIALTKLEELKEIQSTNVLTDDEVERSEKLISELRTIVHEEI